MCFPGIMDHITVEHYLPYGITQCYLPPDSGECECAMP